MTGRPRRDLTGQKFGRLTVVSYAGRSGWFCRCECTGTVRDKPYRRSNLVFGISTSCGCVRREASSKRHLKDLTGLRFGRLVVTGRAGNSSHGNARWFAKCDCNQEIREKPYLSGNLVAGTTHSCGCFNSESKYGRHRKDPGVALRNGLFQRYRVQAEKRGYEFALTFEQFQDYLTQPCLYCGRTGVNTTKSAWQSLNYNGIDRLDNSLGYFAENCVTCCGDCNYMRSDLTLDKFLELVRLIAEHAKDLK